jgi:hypothetical protein
MTGAGVLFLPQLWYIAYTIYPSQMSYFQRTSWFWSTLCIDKCIKPIFQIAYIYDNDKSLQKKEDVTTQSEKISVIFEPASELNSRLNDEREFRFVEVPTEEGKQDAEDNKEPSDNPETPLDDNNGF